MSRTVSLTFRQEFNAEQTGDVPVCLVTITHPSLGAPIYLSSDPTARISVDPLVYGTESRSNSYMFLPMAATLPDDSDGTPPAIKIVIDNVSRELVPTVRSAGPTGIRAKVTVELVLASDPDTVEASWPAFDLTAAPYDSGSVTLTLSLNALAVEPFPSGVFSPAGFGGLF